MNKPYLPTFASKSTPTAAASTLTPDAVSRITSLTASRDAEAIQRVISEKYGFVPTLTYCSELIAFVEALTDGQQ